MIDGYPCCDNCPHFYLDEGDEGRCSVDPSEDHIVKSKSNCGRHPFIESIVASVQANIGLASPLILGAAQGSWRDYLRDVVPLLAFLRGPGVEKKARTR